MAKKSRRAVSRKSYRRKNRSVAKRTQRTRRRLRKGGQYALTGAPVGYHLAGDWSSKMSLGQGADYFKYHEGQHGGGALGMAPFPGAVESSRLPQDLHGPAHIGGLDAAFRDVAGLKDTPYDTASAQQQQPTRGGRRRRSTRRVKRSKRSKASRRRNYRKRGGALGYAPFPSSGMLLRSQMAYAQAGLNPEWKTDVAFDDAKIRDSQ